MNNSNMNVTGNSRLTMNSGSTLTMNADTLTVGSSGNGTIHAQTITASGTIHAQTFNATSDIRLKENIHDLTDSLEKICAIRGVQYNWKTDEEKKLHSGVIAQEV
jgi:uncharacterized protein (DUF2345 family)